MRPYTTKRKTSAPPIANFFYLHDHGPLRSAWNDKATLRPWVEKL